MLALGGVPVMVVIDSPNVVITAVRDRIVVTVKGCAVRVRMTHWAGQGFVCKGVR
jgi:hypothetical protein